LLGRFSELLVTSRTNHSWDVEIHDADEDDAEPRRGWLARILIVALLAGTGSGSAFIWQASGGTLQSLLPRPQGAAVTAMAEKPAGPKEFDALRQQIVSLNQTNQQMLAAQQAEIKRLTDQVAALSGKLDLLQRPVTSAQAAIPPARAAAPATTAAIPAKKKHEAAKHEAAKHEAAKPVAAAKPEPKPVDTRPTGAISTGGAPLRLTR
jgi:hypothetical protein